ncbi:cell envelope-like transcriptional attenuator [Thermoclostridium stercorarium subsp. stercorarium DSM 8532]|uniref:Cell envelope-like transcriptional attenuator n=2 Tax=Thermoclostridium stercorarium TaxID=1510 RepID=L7VRW9_THES1|nr:cell envelope-like transcriptional attenuator [Thermoclostridium stercorarium subsp. stercorarium DSM 8532]
MRQGKNGMRLQKKTKIALLMLLISSILFTVVLIIFAKPADYDKSAQTVQYEEPVPEITVTPEPTAAPEEENEEDQEKTEETKGLTNGQRYYKTLVEPESKNILLIGQDALYQAYDTIIVLSIDEKNKQMKLINFPRDVYIDYSDKVLEELKKANPTHAADPSIQKMNAAHAIAIDLKYGAEDGKFGTSGNTIYAMNFWADLMDEIFGIEIDDYIIIKTEGFRKVVDLFGGVWVNVPVYMHYEDPVQNLYIHLEPGYQLLNGAQAEGFVRFRQGYTREGEFKTYSVYFRQKNQNAFLKAFFEQHVNLKNLSKAGELFDIISKYVKTSVKGNEIFQYANIMQKAIRGKYEQITEVIECSSSKNINGILYEILKTEE